MMKYEGLQAFCLFIWLRVGTMYVNTGNNVPPKNLGTRRLESLVKDKELGKKKQVVNGEK